MHLSLTLSAVLWIRLVCDDESHGPSAGLGHLLLLFPEADTSWAAGLEPVGLFFQHLGKLLFIIERNQELRTKTLAELREGHQDKSNIRSILDLKKKEGKMGEGGEGDGESL